ncbi:hypothetical protein LTR17_005729 [Elasticomyces elasticus]|nr:hypothetical protein LTR17_005729 [Elasticomyces elasticus]
MGGDPWSEHQCRCERCTRLREVTRDAAWMVLHSDEPDHVKATAWDARYAVGRLVEALHRQHMPQCYKGDFEEAERKGLGYSVMEVDDDTSYDEGYDRMDEDIPVQKDKEQQGPDELDQGFREPALTDEESTIVLDDQAEGDEGEVRRNLTEWESAKALAAQEEKDAGAVERTADFAHMQAKYEANGPFKNHEVNPRHELRTCRLYGDDVPW